jgi:hypothetical protein
VYTDVISVTDRNAGNNETLCGMLDMKNARFCSGGCVSEGSGSAIHGAFVEEWQEAEGGIELHKGSDPGVVDVLDSALDFDTELQGGE